jgi:hypothetical protein
LCRGARTMPQMLAARECPRYIAFTLLTFHTT